MTRLMGQARSVAQRWGTQAQHWGRQAAAWVVDAWQRHQERLSTDPTYRSAVLAGIAALVTALLPHPSIASAFTRLVDDLLPDPPTRRWTPPETPWGPATEF